MSPLTCCFGGPSLSPSRHLLLLLLFLSLSRVGGDCTHKRVANATLRSGSAKDSYPVGTILQYRCIPGYEPIPGKTLSLTCLATSKWSEENPRFCQGRRCPTINLENGRIIESNDLRLGDEITLGCNEGYRMIGAKKLRCILRDSKVDWHKELPYCQRIPCLPPPNIANGRHSGTTDGHYDYGTTVTYTCNTHYSLIGNPTISCLAAADGVNGEWRPDPPQCKVVACRKPVIQNGGLATVSKPVYTYGNRVIFVCNRGYTLVGNDSSICGADNAWHPPVPRCVPGTTTVTTTLTSGTTKKTTSSTTHSTIGGGGGGGGDGGGGGGGGGGGDYGGGGDDAIEPENRPTNKPLTTLADDPDTNIASKIVVGFVLALLVTPCLLVAFWKCRSSMKTREPADTSTTAPSDKPLTPKGSALEPKRSQLE